MTSPTTLSPTTLSPTSSVRETYTWLQARLSHVAPDVELQIKAEIVYEIQRLKVEKNAVILGHNYMEPVLFHSIPDFVGDSLFLSRKAAETDKDIIVFCGVEFMAETAKILNPEKTVLLPAAKAGCSLAASITAEDVRQLKAQFPGAPVVTYVNTYADVKAESDICCTSGNAVAVVNSLDAETILFIPDEYLARNVAQETGKKIIVPQPKRTTTPLTFSFDGVDGSTNGHTNGQANGHDQPGVVGWHGRCEVHEKFTVDDIRTIRAQFPDVAIVSHPECSPEVVAASDFSGSTTAMIRFVEKSSAPHYLLLTECSMGDNITASNPDKEMLRLCNVRCPHMNQITLEDTLAALRHNQYKVEVPEEIRVRAARSVQRMIEIG
ncbi:MAG: quinolinate synthase NadA [Caldilineaceae bacterium]|nr:quinolinate synthase NadA [Caldilineaceae bacterium]